MKRYITLFSMIFVLLAGCSKPLETMASARKTTVSVNVHGVNYTSEPFRYVIVDQRDPANQAGGEHVGPFQGGGIRCCFKLPKKWTPGLQVKVRATHWLKEDAQGNLPEVTKVHTVEIPRYPDGKAGELWILRTAAGGVDLVVSDVEPGHAQWPGKVKGWPEPSLAYQRERWELYLKLAKDNVSLYRKLQEELQNQTRTRVSSAWDSYKEHDPDTIKAFTGPDDKKFEEYLRKRYAAGLLNGEAEVEELLKEKP